MLLFEGGLLYADYPDDQLSSPTHIQPETSRSMVVKCKDKVSSNTQLYISKLTLEGQGKY